MYNVTMNFHVEVCIQYEGCNSRTLMTSGALLLFSLSYVYGQKYSTQREGTFANCLRFTKLYVERPISTLCMRDIPFPETCGHAGRKRTNISPKLLFAVPFSTRNAEMNFSPSRFKGFTLRAGPSFAMLAPA